MRSNESARCSVLPAHRHVRWAQTDRLLVGSLTSLAGVEQALRSELYTEKGIMITATMSPNSTGNRTENRNETSGKSSRRAQQNTALNPHQHPQHARLAPAW